MCSDARSTASPPVVASSVRIAGRDQDVAEQLHVLLVVLDDEDPLARHGVDRPRGQREDERAPAARARSRARSGRRGARRTASRARGPGRSPRAARRPASVCWNSSKIRSWSSGAMPGPVSATETLHLAVDPRRAHVDLPAGGRELHGVREQVEDDLLDPALVALDDVDLRIGRERDADPVLRRRARAPSPHRARAPPAARTARTSSSTCPASTLERSRTSLISESRWCPEETMSSRYSACFSLTVAEHLVAQHLREADDRVERRPQLVRHVGQELRLVPARRLELRVEAPELVVHPVDVGAQRPELVSIVDLDVPGEVARRDRGEASVDPLDRPDHRPREDEPEHEREDDRPHGDADEQGPRAVERARVPGDQVVDLRRVPSASTAAVLVEVARELLGLARSGGSSAPRPRGSLLRRRGG